MASPRRRWRCCGRPGVDLSATREVAKPTGAAFIVVDPSGENAIIVASGANAEARASQLQGLAFGAGDMLLLQRETPEAEVEAAALLARRRGAKVMLNLAPAGVPSAALIGALDYLCMNEHEAATLGAATGVATREAEGIAAELARRHELGDDRHFGGGGRGRLCRRRALRRGRAQGHGGRHDWRGRRFRRRLRRRAR